MAEETDIQKAIQRLKQNPAKYDKPNCYYDGNHNLAFATDKFVNAFGSLFKEFALNLCPAVVDALRDKLIVTGFRVEDGSDSISDEAWKIWQNNRMGKISGEIHKEAARSGDAYAIVWVDMQKRVTIYPNRAGSCTVFYDEETPGKVMWAAKYWQAADKKIRLNLFYPDRTEKYISKSKPQAPANPLTNWSSGLAYDKNFNVNKTVSPVNYLPDANQFIPFGDEGTAVVVNPYGIVPVFHFGNNADIGSFGASELKQAIPVQDALNKSVLDMLVAMEFSAFRQRWIAGIEMEYDNDNKPIPPFIAASDRVWMVGDPEVKFGDFAASDLKPFLDVKESFRVDIAAVTGTPLYYFMQIGGEFPSGESLKKSETRFINKVRDRMEAFGNVWEDVMSFALMIEKKGDGVRLFTEWEDPAPLTEREQLEALIIKQELGVSGEQLLTEAGYGKDEVAKMLAEQEARRDAAARTFNAGEETEEEEN